MKRKEIEAPSLLSGLLTMIISILLFAENRGDNPFVLWLFGMLIIVVSSFLIGMVVYDLIYSFAHEVLSDNNKAILITAGIIAFAVYMCALFNVYSDSPIWGWMISYK